MSMGAIDLPDHVPGVGDYRAVFAKSEPVQIGTVEFRALTLEALIASKRAVRRKKDLEHLIELEAILALRRERPSWAIGDDGSVFHDAS